MNDLGDYRLGGVAASRSLAGAGFEAVRDPQADATPSPRGGGSPGDEALYYSSDDEEYPYKASVVGIIDKCTGALGAFYHGDLGLGELTLGLAEQEFDQTTRSGAIDLTNAADPTRVPHFFDGPNPLAPAAESAHQDY